MPHFGLIWLQEFDLSQYFENRIAPIISNIMVDKIADGGTDQITSKNNTKGAVHKSPHRLLKDMSMQDRDLSHTYTLNQVTQVIRRQRSEYHPTSEQKERPVRRSLGGGPLLAKIHFPTFAVDNYQRTSNSQLQQNFYKDCMEQNFNGGGGGSSTNVSNHIQPAARQHNSDFMYLQRQHQILSPKGTSGEASINMLEQSQGSIHNLGLMPFKQMSEPTNNLQNNFGGIVRYQIQASGGAPIFTERSSMFSQGTLAQNGANGIITQYQRPKTNSPFPPFGTAGATAQSTRSAQKSSISQNPLHQIGPFAPLTGDQLQDSSNSVPLVTQVPILSFPNMDQTESEEGGNPLLLRRQHFNNRGSRVQPQQQLQHQISDQLNNTYSTQGADNLSSSGGGALLNGSIGINPLHYNTNAPGSRSFHQRQKSRDILRIQGGGGTTNSDQQIPSQPNGGQQQFMGNFNIGGTWTSSQIIMSGANIPLPANMIPQSSEAQSQGSSFHQQNDNYGGGVGSGRQSPKSTTDHLQRNPYITEINYSDQEQHQQNYGFHRGVFNSDSKPQRRQGPEVQIPTINPQFQQSQQVFMQNNFFIQQMLASPSNNQIRGGPAAANNVQKNFPPNNQQMPAFDASLSGANGGSNAFFDLMEMSSVLSSTGLGDPLTDSTGNPISGSTMFQQIPGYITQGGGLLIQQNNGTAQMKDLGLILNQDLSKEQLRVQVPKDISSRQSTQSRVRMNRLNKMMAASASQQAATHNDQNRDAMCEVSNLQGTMQAGVLGQSFANSYESENSSRQPIWMQNISYQDKATPETDSQLSQNHLLNKQKMTLLNQSYRDLHQAELLTQSMLANTKHQMTPQQQNMHNQLGRANVGDFSQQMIPQPDFNIQNLVNTNRNISGSRRQLQIVPSTSNERENSLQKRFIKNESAAQSMILDGNDSQLLIQPILGHHNSAQDAVVDDNNYHSAAGSRESSQSNRQSTFCIEMGKAKPKILKNSLSSAYQVFMPISTKAATRRGNHRIFQGTELMTSQGSRKNLEPQTQQNSPKRQGSKMKQTSSSINRDTLASHSQRANEFSQTNPSYYVTFNQDSHLEEHKFNPVPNLIGTTGGLIADRSNMPGTGLAGPRHRQQQLSVSSNGGSAQNRRTNAQRSDSKNSSHSKSRGELGSTQANNNYLIKSRPNIRRVEVPSQPTNPTPLGGEKDLKEEQEIVVKSANIIGINRKIKINRIVNRNPAPIAGIASTQIQEPLLPIQEVQAAPQSQAQGRRNFIQEQVSKVSQQRTRVSSFDGLSQTSKRSEDIASGQASLYKPISQNNDEIINPTEPNLRSPQRHNQSQIIEPIGQFTANKVMNSNGGGSHNNLAQTSGGHIRRQSQQVQLTSAQKQMLPPRHRSSQKIFTTRHENSGERKIGSQGFQGQFQKAQDLNGTFSLLQQNQIQMRLPAQEQPIAVISAFPQILKQASQTKFEFSGSGEHLSGNIVPLDRTASFQPTVLDRTLTSNSSGNSLHHRRSSRGFQGINNASQQPQLMLASTYNLSNGPQEQVKQQNVFSPQSVAPVRTGSMMRKRRIIPNNSRETSGNFRSENLERSTSNRRLQQQSDAPQQKDSIPGTTTFSQLVLSQQLSEGQQIHSQNSPPLNTLDSQHIKSNSHYETPRIGAASIRQQQPRNLKEHPKMRQQAHTTSGSSPVRRADEQPYRMLTRQ